jgi:hypothetical protein
VSTGITQPLSLIPAHAPDLNPLASFGPMWVPRAASLYRLLRTPAGCRPFPTLSPQSLYGCLVPCPVAPPRCTYSFLPVGQRPHLKNQRFGAQNHRHNATSAAGLFRGCRHSVMFRLPYLLDPQVAPTVMDYPQGGRAVYTTHRSVGYLPRDVVSLRVQHE